MEQCTCGKTLGGCDCRRYETPKPEVELTCMVCGKSFTGPEPQMCCSGRDCGCMGLPVDPVVCSEECYNNFPHNKSKQQNVTQPTYPLGGYAPGNYHCKCLVCGEDFTGDKRAFQCKPCAVADYERYEALTDQEKAEHDKRFRKAVEAVFKQFNKL